MSTAKQTETACLFNQHSNSQASIPTTPMINFTTDLLQHWLHLSITAKSNEEIKEATFNISSHYLTQGFLPSLLAIISKYLPNIFENRLYENLVLSSLAQLKNVIRKYWNERKKKIISPKDKEIFTYSIIPINQAFADIYDHKVSYKFRKLIKDAIQLTRQETISIYKQVINIMANKNIEFQFLNLPACLNILLGWSEKDFVFNQEFDYTYATMIHEMHPHLLAFLQGGENLIQSLYEQFAHVNEQEKVNLIEQYNEVKRRYEEILYLSIKLMYRVIQLECVDRYRSIAVEWASIAIRTIQSEYVQLVPSNSNDADMGSKGNNRFNFYHGKKWALKFLYRLISRVLVLKKKRKFQNDQERMNYSRYNKLTKAFYAENMQLLVQIFHSSWNIIEPDIIKYEEMRCFNKLLECKTLYFVNNYEQEMKLYLSEILPKMMQLSQKQLNIIEEDPIEFIMYESNSAYVTTRIKVLRTMAIVAWIKIAKLTESYCNYKDNAMLLYSFELIKNWTQIFDINNLKIRDVGCEVLLKLKLEFERVPSIKSQLSDLVRNIIIDNLNNFQAHFILLARAFDLMKIYGREIKDETLKYIQQSIIAFYRKFTSLNNLNNSQIFVLVKAGGAIEKLFTQELYLSNEEMKEIIFINFYLIRLTAYEDLINSVNVVLANLSGRATEFAAEIIQYIHDWFKIYLERQVRSRGEMKKNDSLRYDDLPRGILTVLQTLTEQVRTGIPQIINAISSEIFSIAFFLFSDDSDDFFFEYREETVRIIEIFLRYHPSDLPLSDQMNFICRQILVRVAGLNQKVMKFLNQNKDKILANANKPFDASKLLLQCKQTIVYGLQTYLGMIRNYIQFLNFGQSIRSYQQIVQKMIKSKINNTEYLFYLIYRLFIYKAKDDYQKTDESKGAALLLLIYYYQHHQKQKCTAHIDPSVNHSTIKILFSSVLQLTHPPKILKYSVQLFCLWILEVNENLGYYLQLWSNSKIGHFFDRIFCYEGCGLPQIEKTEQKCRCIQGICIFLRIALGKKNIWNFLKPGLINSLVKYAIEFTHNNTCDIDFSFESLDSFDKKYKAKFYLQDYDEDLTNFTSYDEAINVGTEVSNEQCDSEEYDAPIVFENDQHMTSQENSDQQEYNLEQVLQQSYLSPLQQWQEQSALLNTLKMIQSSYSKLYWSIIKGEYNVKIIDIIQMGGYDGQAEFKDIYQPDCFDYIDDDDLSNP